MKAAWFELDDGYVIPNSDGAGVTEALRHGMLQHRIAARLPLAEIARANELVEQGGSSGCIVVDVTA